MKEFNLVKFLEEIAYIPHWVKNDSNLSTFCEHLQYRLLQKTAALAYIQSLIELTPEQDKTFLHILGMFEDAYNGKVGIKNEKA